MLLTLLFALTKPPTFLSTYSADVYSTEVCDCLGGTWGFVNLNISIFIHIYLLMSLVTHHRGAFLHGLGLEVRSGGIIMHFD